MKIPKFLQRIYFRYFFEVKRGKCLFIPNASFCKTDKASIYNFKADNCLIFVRYLLEKGFEKEIIVVSTDKERAIKEELYCREHFPNAKISFIPNISRDIKIAWASSEYIFMSEGFFLYPKKNGQKYISLGYYPISLKNDCYGEQTAYIGYRAKKTVDIDIIVSSSLINSQIDSAAYEIPFYKFKPIGKVRSDMLLKDDDETFVRDYFKEQCKDYAFSKIILYTPTHRDYERSTFDIKRSILGFDVNKEKFEKFLRENELLIVCKLHPDQNASIVGVDLPKGVVNFKGNDTFGLIELMKASDMLMTDYTSTYVDYLLLNKPVLFNLYDYELYEKTRGLAFYPFERICAGEIFRDEESFYVAMENTLNNPKKYEQRRAELTEYFNTYHTDVCEKTYECVFANEKKI